MKSLKSSSVPGLASSKEIFVPLASSAFVSDENCSGPLPPLMFANESLEL